jgi:hypothetical protein
MELKQTAHIEKLSGGSLRVTSYVKIDDVLYRVGAFGLGAEHRGLAERLARAIEAGVVYTNLQLITRTEDTPYVKAGTKYVSCNCTVIGRTMNADLRRLGF